MKLISLNTWGGKVFNPLMDFILQNIKTTDIFCFQEIYNTKSDVKNYHDIRANLLDELVKILPNFRFFYHEEIKGFDSCPHPVQFDLSVGKATFIKKDVEITSSSEILISGNKSEIVLKKDFSNLPITLQYVEFTLNRKLFTVCNFHGTPFPGSKLDTETRLEQSTKIINFLNSKPLAKILAGDFNLLPQTQGVKILEKDFSNLIKEFNIERTRSNLSPYAGKPDFQKYADYVFVSPDINVINFEVPNLEIADHLPLILEFS